MELQEWRRLAFQSIALLAVVLVSCVGFSSQMQQQVGTGVQAEKKKTAKSQPIASQQEKKETPKVATRALVEERSDTYIKIAKGSISPDKVYLQNKYMNFQIVLTFQGVETGCISFSDVFRVQGYHVNNEKISKKDTLLQKLDIYDQKLQEREKNKIQVRLTMKNAYEPILFESEDAYYISLLSARKAHKKIVVVDAGHGGMDEGTSSSNLKYLEKDIVLSVQEKLAMLLDKSDIAVYYTRTRDERVSKKARVKLANVLQADVFVSIHCNALAGGGSTYGVETLYSKKKPKFGSLSNKKLADIMLNQVTECTGRKKRGTIVREGLFLMRYAKVPSTIVEIGYMTNQDDMNFMKKEIGQQKIAEGIYQGILHAIGQ